MAMLTNYSSLIAERPRPLQLLVAACVCCSRARLRQAHPLPLLLPVCLRFQLLLLDCALFSCCSPRASASAAAPDQVRFGCYSPIASASTAAPGLRPLQLLLARLRPLQLLLPDCVRFNCCSPDCVRFDCCSPIAYIRLLDSSPCPSPMFSNTLRGVRGSVNKLKYEGRASLESNPAPRTSHFRHSHTDTR